MYIWKQSDWPGFIWSYESIVPALSKVHRKQGHLLGQIEGLGFRAKEKAYVETLTKDVVKTSEIEGEILDEQQVRSSIARKLGLMHAGIHKRDHAVEGIVDMTIDATGNAVSPLTTERLFQWHRLLFPKNYSGWHKIAVGRWRDDSNGPMVVQSGSEGKIRIHFEAPPASRLDREMKAFLEWFEKGTTVDWILKAAVAHIWFVTVHPFDDGNGRIARAISDLALARADNMSQRFYSMSARIRTDRKQYYDVLERSQKGSLDITQWVDWFINCVDQAIDDAQCSVDSSLVKQLFWNDLELEIGEHQRKVLNKLLDESRTSLKTSDYARIAKCSQDTAYRDILELVSLGVFSKDTSGGRSTKYLLRTDSLKAPGSDN